MLHKIVNLMVYNLILVLLQSINLQPFYILIILKQYIIIHN